MGLTVQIAKPWQVKTPIVYRYMDQQYIDEFFETGRLRLSTFKAFAKHDDEQRQDTKEGQNMVVGIGGGHTIVAVTGHGHRSLIFCTSTIADEQLMRDFGCDGYFKISNTTSFAINIANKIPGFTGGLEGMCAYMDRRMIKNEMDGFKIDDLKNEDGQMDLGKMASTVFGVGGGGLFCQAEEVQRAERISFRVEPHDGR